MKPLVTDELWAMVAPLLPQRRPQPKGGRPWVDDRATLSGIPYVLRSGIPWRRAAPIAADGARLRLERDVLAPTEGVAAAGRLEAAAPAHAGAPRGRRAGRLDAGGSRLKELGREKGGTDVGPNPTD